MTLRFRLFLLLLTLAVAPGWAATSTPVALGNDGTLYRIWTGIYGEIFGLDPAYPASTPVMALDVVSPGQPLSRLLVPGSEGMDVESLPILLVDSASEKVHLVWSSRSPGAQPVESLKLRTYSSGEWSAEIELSGASQAERGSLLAALTQDSYATVVADVETRVTRRILHLVWTEELAGETRTLYSPAVFLDGLYSGWSPLVELERIVNTSDAPGATPVRPEVTLSTTPSSGISISFSLSNRLISVEVQALPGELGELAEMARGSIVDLAAQVGVEDRPRLAEMARGSIVDLAGRFHSSVAASFGDRARDVVLAASLDEDGPSLAEFARGSIVDLGREILGSGVANSCAAEGALIEVPRLFSNAAADFSQFLVVRQIGAWDLPSDMQSADRVLLSLDGSRAILAREGEGSLSYRETQADGTWSEFRAFNLTHLSLSDAWIALERRALGF